MDPSASAPAAAAASNRHRRQGSTMHGGGGPTPAFSSITGSSATNGNTASGANNAGAVSRPGSPASSSSSSASATDLYNMHIASRSATPAPAAGLPFADKQSLLLANAGVSTNASAGVITGTSATDLSYRHSMPGSAHGHSAALGNSAVYGYTADYATNDTSIISSGAAVVVGSAHAGPPSLAHSRTRAHSRTGSHGHGHGGDGAGGVGSVSAPSSPRATSNTRQQQPPQFALPLAVVGNINAQQRRPSSAFAHDLSALSANILGNNNIAASPPTPPVPVTAAGTQAVLGYGTAAPAVAFPLQSGDSLPPSLAHATALPVIAHGHLAARPVSQSSSLSHGNNNVLTFPQQHHQQQQPSRHGHSDSLSLATGAAMSLAPAALSRPASAAHSHAHGSSSLAYPQPLAASLAHGHGHMAAGNSASAGGSVSRGATPTQIALALGQPAVAAVGVGSGGYSAVPPSFYAPPGAAGLGLGLGLGAVAMPAPLPVTVNTTGPALGGLAVMPGLSTRPSVTAIPVFDNSTDKSVKASTASESDADSPNAVYTAGAGTAAAAVNSKRIKKQLKHAQRAAAKAAAAEQYRLKQQLEQQNTRGDGASEEDDDVFADPMAVTTTNTAAVTRAATANVTAIPASTRLTPAVASAAAVAAPSKTPDAVARARDAVAAAVAERERAAATAAVAATASTSALSSAPASTLASTSTRALPSCTGPAVATPGLRTGDTGKQKQQELASEAVALVSSRVALNSKSNITSKSKSNAIASAVSSKDVKSDGLSTTAAKNSCANTVNTKEDVDDYDEEEGAMDSATRIVRGSSNVSDLSPKSRASAFASIASPSYAATKTTKAGSKQRQQQRGRTGSMVAAEDLAAALSANIDSTTNAVDVKVGDKVEFSLGSPASCTVRPTPAVANSITTKSQRAHPQSRSRSRSRSLRSDVELTSDDERYNTNSHGTKNNTALAVKKPVTAAAAAAAKLSAGSEKPSAKTRRHANALSDSDTDVDGNGSDKIVSRTDDDAGSDGDKSDAGEQYLKVKLRREAEEREATDRAVAAAVAAAEAAAEVAAARAAAAAITPVATAPDWADNSDVSVRRHVDVHELAAKYAQMHTVPQEVERWSVKEPTRIEFRNVSVRVIKRLPKNRGRESVTHELSVQEQATTNGTSTNRGKGRSGASAATVGTGAGAKPSAAARYRAAASAFATPDTPSLLAVGHDSGARRWDKNSTNGTISSSNAHGHGHDAVDDFAAPIGRWDEDDDDDADGGADDSGGRGSACPALSWMCNREAMENVPQTILDGLSGVIEPGRMVAIMGASGAGKTTLLNALSGRIQLKPTDMRKRKPGAAAAASSTAAAGGGAWSDEDEDGAATNGIGGAGGRGNEEEYLKKHGISTGNVLLNGTRVSETELGSLTGYVMQEDVLLGTLTPRETLRFAAKMQLPEAIGEERKMKRVERILKQLDLLDCADTPIGTAFVRGISGGQRRRVSVGVEMIRDPAILFLDEPTSGLDSTTAVKVMKVLKDLVRTGRTVIFTIHSPNTKIFDMFDTLVLLSRGKLAYFGPAPRALDYFTGLGYNCPASANPAEFFLNVLQQNSTDMLRDLIVAEQKGTATALSPHDPRHKSVELIKSKLRIKSSVVTEAALVNSSSINEEDENDNADGNSAAKKTVNGLLALRKARYPFTSLSSMAIKRIIASREDTRLNLVAEQYLMRPVPRDPRLTPFLTNYIPRLRASHHEDGRGGAGGAGASGGVGGAAGLGAPGEFCNSASTVAGLEGAYGIHLDREAGAGGTEHITPGVPQLAFKHQLKHLSHRTFLHVIRQPMNTVMRVAVNVFLSVFVGLLFFQTGNKQQSVYARVGFLFFMTSIQAFITIVAAVLTFTEERALFLREKQKHIYSTSAYFLGRTFVDMALQTVLAIIFGAFAYPMVGLQGDMNKFVGYIFALILTGQATHSYALIVGALVPYRTVALMLSPIVMVPFMMVTGFFAHNETMPGWLKWLQVLSPQKFMFESVMGVEFNGLELGCDPHEYITVPLDDGTMEQFCPMVNGSDVMHLFSLSGSHYAGNAFAVIGLMIGVRILAYFALRFSAWRHITKSTGS